jgi:hypothetical protein
LHLVAAPLTFQFGPAGETYPALLILLQREVSPAAFEPGHIFLAFIFASGRHDKIPATACKARDSHVQETTMTRWTKVALAAVLVVAVGLVVYAQRPDDDGPPRKKDGKGPGGKRFILGKVLPPPLYEELDLTPEQKKKLDALEAEVKKKLEAILTEKQKRQVEEFRPRGPGGPGGRPQRDGKRPGEDDNKGDRPPVEEDGTARSQGGIQWFATLERGLAEARRTGKPILFLSAAPHCGGISGIW